MNENKEKKEIVKDMESKRKKVCFAASSGGHFEQLSMLKPLMDEYDSFVVTEETAYKATIKKLAVDEHIPIIFVTNYDPVNIFTHSQCVHCKNLYYNVTNTQKWKKYIETNKKRYVFVYGANVSEHELWRIINKYTTSNNPIASYMKYRATNLYA